MIYKICSRQMWQDAVAAGAFTGAAVDLQDGFIHFSGPDQVRETAVRHFAGQDDLLLLAVDETSLDGDLRWEVSRGGALFPHLYGQLNVADVREVFEMPLDDSGCHVFPELHLPPDSGSPDPDQ